MQKSLHIQAFGKTARRLRFYNGLRENRLSGRFSKAFTIRRLRLPLAMSGNVACGDAKFRVWRWAIPRAAMPISACGDDQRRSLRFQTPLQEPPDLVKNLYTFRTKKEVPTASPRVKNCTQAENYTLLYTINSHCLSLLKTG